MDWLGTIALLIGVLLIILGVGMTFSVELITVIVEKFLGVIAIIFGLILAIGGAMIIREE
ncbi:MFS transporter permease [Methanoplanus sp. FWC-SCC4]|uniref:MFS transporter permease n=1 Tax=Methanochimaera problematica TaxID=2609417 RepID=A0AA97FCS6_9EURY|nr:MFS transporter permease [Methanoplanus sp. FWC-SCC4]WOF16672.1 MFS transporter permease [Methanoplanus sp. FWC-SCC4]